MIFSVSGVAFSGKTYLISKLLHDFPDFKIVNFEQFYKKKEDISILYFNFLQHIHNLSKDYHVICESIFPITNNPFVIYPSDNVLNIKCYIDYKKHLENKTNFENKFGIKYSKRRLIGNLELKRNDYYQKYFLKVDGLHYNGINYENIKQGIKNACAR